MNRGPIKKGLIPQKATPAIKRRLERVYNAKKLGYPERWKNSDKPLRQLWNRYYIRTAYTLFRKSMQFHELAPFTFHYHLAMDWINHVVRERRFKIGNRADIWRDALNNRYRLLIQKEQDQKAKSLPIPHPITIQTKL